MNSKSSKRCSIQVILGHRPFSVCSQQLKRRFELLARAGSKLFAKHYEMKCSRFLQALKAVQLAVQPITGMAKETDPLICLPPIKRSSIMQGKSTSKALSI